MFIEQLLGRERFPIVRLNQPAMSKTPEPPLELKFHAYNNQGFLTEEQMAKVFRELLAKVKIVKELHCRDGGGGGIDRIDLPVWETKEIIFEFSSITFEFSRTVLTGATGKKTGKAILKLMQEFARCRAPLEHRFWVRGMRQAKLGLEFDLYLDAKRNGTELWIALPSSEASPSLRKQLFAELIATAKLPVVMKEADGKITFEPADSDDEQELKVVYPAGKLEAAVEAFFSVCAHNQMRFKEMPWCIDGEDGHFTKCPQLPQIIHALGAAKLPAKRFEVFWCGWQLKRWQDWPLLLTAANHYDKIVYMMPFQAAMPSGSEFQLWLNVTPKKGFKFQVRVDKHEHMKEFVSLTTTKMKDTPDLSRG